MKPRTTTPPPRRSATQPGQISGLAASKENQAHAVSQVQEAKAKHTIARRIAVAEGKPPLDAEQIVPFLDWVAIKVTAEHMTHAEAAIMLRVAELAISTRHASAQGKATAHSEGLQPEESTPV